MSLKKMSATPIISTQNPLNWEECHFCILKLQHIRAASSPPWEGLSWASGNLGAYWQVRAPGGSRDLLSVIIIWNEGSHWKYHPGRFLQRKKKIPVILNISWSSWELPETTKRKFKRGSVSSTISGNTPLCYVIASKWYNSFLLKVDPRALIFSPANTN